MKPNELRKFNKKELEERLTKKIDELGTKQFDVRVRKDNDYASLKFLRKEIARIKTILKSGTFAKEETKEKVEKKDKKTTKKSKK